MSICPTSEQHSPRNNNNNNNHVYSREFQTMLDGLDEEGHVAEKKRRLSVDQVKALEKNFEVDNKLEPDRKVQLAQELGLQPRQVAVWFQNRRARWKTKQLERDYNVLKTNFDSLKHNFDNLNHDKETLLNQIRELKSKLGEDGCNTESDLSVKEEIMLPESDNNPEQSSEEDQDPPGPTSFGSSETKDLNFSDSFNNGNNSTGLAISVFPHFKEGSSDSEDSNSPTVGGILVPPTSSQLKLDCSSPVPAAGAGNGFLFQTQFVKLEETNFFNGEETCDFFSDEQHPSLQQWYYPDPWNTSLELDQSRR